IKAIAQRVHLFAAVVAEGLNQLGYEIAHEVYFDTLHVKLGDRPATDVIGRAREQRINLRSAGPNGVIVALDETVTMADVHELLDAFTPRKPLPASGGLAEVDSRYDERFARTSPYLTHPVFNSYHSETEMLRFLKRLENK